MDKRWLYLALLLGVVFMTQSYAGIYKWTDADVHFSEQPPSNTKSQSVAVHDEPPPDSYADQEEQQTKDWEKGLAADSKARKKAEQKAEERKRIDQEHCKAAKNSLFSYSQGGIYYHFDDNGKRIFLSDKEVANRRARLQQEVDRYCGK